MNASNLKPKESLAARKTARPAAVRFSEQALIETSFFDPERPLPLVIRPKGEMKLEEWAPRNRDLIETNLRKYGAILFRGFHVDSVDKFDTSVNAFTDRLMTYTEGATPRLMLKDKVYTSTEFPPEHPIAMHNELSYIVTYPTKLWFCCVIAPPFRGETPIADVRRVYQRLSPETRAKFEEKGWKLVRNYGDGFGLTWQDSFHTDDPAVVEKYCREQAITWEWKDGDRLRTWQTRPAVLDHPQTGDRAWFNHIAFWHDSSLAPHVREVLRGEFEPEDMPYQTFYGDGTAIEDEVAAELREAYLAERVVFDWYQGDLLMMDNLIAAHGRMPYQGDRRTLVAMADPYRRPDLDRFLDEEAAAAAAAGPAVVA